jgi:hypothetical protein
MSDRRRFGWGKVVGWLLEVLDEGASSDEHSGNPLHEPKLEIFEVGFRGQGGDVEFFQGLRDAFGLRAGEASLFEFFDDAVRVDHERRYAVSVASDGRQNDVAKLRAVGRSKRETCSAPTSHRKAPGWTAAFDA